MRTLLEPVRRRLDGLRIGAGPGEVLHTGIGAVAPGHQFVKRDRGRRATTRLEAHVPRALYRRQSRLRHLRQGERGFLGCLAEHHEYCAPRQWLTIRMTRFEPTLNW